MIICTYDYFIQMGDREIMRKKFPQAALLVLALILTLASAASANFIAGVRAYVAGNYDNALLEWAENAKDGDAKSMAYIGYIYFGGLGGYNDDAKALEWFTKAADLGDPDGTANLARMYAHGWGVSRDIGLAYELMMKVEGADNFAAQMTASEFYEMGFGTEVDLERALKHARRVPAMESGMPMTSAREQRIRDLESKLAGK
jgi:TPR repeat protein